LDEQQDAENLAHLYKTHNPKLRVRYRRIDEDGKPLDDVRLWCWHQRFGA
jgi:hypothetical protein